MSCTQQIEDGTFQKPFTIRQGLTFTLELQGTTYNGGVLDLTGRTGSGQLRTNFSDVASAASFTVALTAATRGIAQATMGADITAALAPGTYLADFEFSLSASDVIGTQTLYVKVVREVTQ